MRFETIDELMDLVDLLTFTRDLLDRKKKHKKHKKKHKKRHGKKKRGKKSSSGSSTESSSESGSESSSENSGESSDFLAIIRDLLDRHHKKHKHKRRHGKKSKKSKKSSGGSSNSESSGESGDSKFDLKEFQELALKKHNELRALHKDTPPMVLDEKLCAGSKAWAHKLAFTKAHGHSHVHGVGENIWGSSGAKSAKTDVGARATQSWYNEEKNYNYHTGKGNGNKSYKNGATGHFTAVVWDTSVKMGIGMAYNPKTKKTYVVSRYLPPGNFSGTSAHKKHIHPLK